MIKGRRVWKRRSLSINEMSDLADAWGEVGKSYGNHTFLISGEGDQLTLTTDISWRDLVRIFHRAGMRLDPHQPEQRGWRYVPPPEPDRIGLKLATGIQWEEGK